MGDSWNKEKPKRVKSQKQLQEALASTQQDLENTQAALMELAATLATTQTIGGK